MLEGVVFRLHDAFSGGARRSTRMAIAAGILAAAFFPAQAHAQSSGCSAINGGLLDFQSVFANGEPTSGTTSNYQIHVALSMMRTTTAYTDNVSGSSFVPDGVTTYALSLIHI